MCCPYKVHSVTRIARLQKVNIRKTQTNKKATKTKLWKTSSSDSENEPVLIEDDSNMDVSNENMSSSESFSTGGGDDMLDSE